jgi:hypothetical protein
MTGTFAFDKIVFLKLGAELGEADTIEALKCSWRIRQTA